MGWWYKRRRAEVRLTPEGWVYLVFLAFITVGSILRNVNLLVLMAGLMYTPLILQWRTCNQLKRKLRAKRKLPSRVHARQTANLSWAVHNRSDHTTAWNVMVADVLQRSDDVDVETPKHRPSLLSRVKSSLAGLTDPSLSIVESVFEWLEHASRWMFDADARRSEKVALMMFNHVRGRQRRTGVWRVFFPFRGRYQAGPAQLTAKSMLGLVVCEVKIAQEADCYVAPALGKLSPGWIQRLQSIRAGDETGHRRRGQDQEEFYALRPWRSGDSKKHIHWRTTARYGQPFVKQFDQKDDRDVAIVLDLWRPDSAASLFFEPDSSEGSLPQLFTDRAETALSFAATVLSRAKLAVQGRITLGVCGQRTDFFPGRQGDLISRVMRSLAIAMPSGQPRLAETLLSVAEVVTPGTPIFVVSTRDQPRELLLSREPAITAATQDAAAADRSLSPAYSVSDTIARKKVARVQAAVTWLNVGSEKFTQSFSLGDQTRGQANRSVKRSVQAPLMSSEEMKNKRPAQTKAAFDTQRESI